jgi:hypothetical protein
MSLIELDGSGQAKQETIVPMIDGGSEGTED